MDGDASISRKFWGLALGGKNAFEVINDTVERPFHVSKAVLNEPLRLNTRDEYASLYLETEDIEVELVRFVLEDGVEKPLSLTFKRGDKVTFRVVGFPTPSIHLIGCYLDDVTSDDDVTQPPLRVDHAEHRKLDDAEQLQKLLMAWSNKMIVRLVENEMRRDAREKDDEETNVKLMEMVLNIEEKLEKKVEVDHVKIAGLMGEIRGDIQLLREGLGSVVEMGQDDVKKLRKEVNAANVAKRLEEVKQEMKNLQERNEASIQRLKDEMDIELDKMKKELKKTITTTMDFEEEFDEIKRLVRNMNY